MEFYEVINNRRTVREWQKKDVSLETVKHIINAGLAAPSHNHLREWEFIVLHTPDEKENALQYAKAWADEHGLTDPNRLFPSGTVMQRMYQYAMPRQYSMLENTAASPWTRVTSRLHRTCCFRSSSMTTIPRNVSWGYFSAMPL